MASSNADVLAVAKAYRVECRLHDVHADFRIVLGLLLLAQGLAGFPMPHDSAAPADDGERHRRNAVVERTLADAGERAVEIPAEVVARMRSWASKRVGEPVLDRESIKSAHIARVHGITTIQREYVDSCVAVGVEPDHFASAALLSAARQKTHAFRAGTPPVPPRGYAERQVRIGLVEVLREEAMAIGVKIPANVAERLDEWATARCEP